MGRNDNIFIQFQQGNEKYALVSLIALAEHVSGAVETFIWLDESMDTALIKEAYEEAFDDSSAGGDVVIKTAASEDIFKIKDLIIVTEYDLVLQSLDDEWRLFSPDFFEEERLKENSADNPCIISFSNSIPWENNHLHHPLERVWWKYAEKTPYYREICEDYVNQGIVDSSIRTQIEDMIEKNKTLSIDIKDAAEAFQKLKNSL